MELSRINKQTMTSLEIAELTGKRHDHVMRGAFCWAVTGTFHGSIIEAETEGEARRIFHKHYNGESITRIKKRNVPTWAF